MTITSSDTTILFKPGELVKPPANLTISVNKPLIYAIADIKYSNSISYPDEPTVESTGTFKTLNRVKVMVDQLEPGMFVSDLDIPWEQSNFLLQGFTIQDEMDIESIKSQCEYVWVDFKDEIQYKRFRFRSSVSKTYREKVLTQKQMDNFNIREFTQKARVTRTKSSKQIKSVMDKVMLGEDFQVYSVKSTVKEMVREVLENEEAMMMMIMLKNTDDRTAEHCLNTSILALGFARYLGYGEKDLEEIGMAALLHDIGKSRIDPDIINKPGKLTELETRELARHCQYGYEILIRKRDIPGLVLDAAVNHHERLGGIGYPRKLKGKQISPKVHLISICDSFESITAEQPYRSAKSVVEAYKMLMQDKNKRFSEKMVLKFIEWRGIYPPGTIVEMTNGEVGIVVSTNIKHKLKPRVLLVLDEHKEPRKSRLIDMSKLAADAESKPYAIFKAYENEAFGINLQDYLEEGLIIATAR